MAVLLVIILPVNAIKVSMGGSDMPNTAVELQLSNDASATFTAVGGNSRLSVNAPEENGSENKVTMQSGDTGFGVSFPGNLEVEASASGNDINAGMAVNGHGVVIPTEAGTTTDVDFQIIRPYWGPWGTIPGYVPGSSDYYSASLTQVWTGYKYNSLYTGGKTVLIENDADLQSTGLNVGNVASEWFTVQEQYDAWTVGNTFPNGYSIRTVSKNGVLQEIPTVLGDKVNTIEFENMGTNGIAALTFTRRDTGKKEITEYATQMNSAYEWSANPLGPEPGKLDFRTVAGNEFWHIIGGNDRTPQTAWYISRLPEQYKGYSDDPLYPGVRRYLNDGEKLMIRDLYK